LSRDNDADGPFPAHPKGDALFGRPHSRYFLMPAEKCVVAGSLGFRTAS
jgi:hypothetical protein